MDSALLGTVVARHAELPVDCRIPPATEEEIQAFEKQFGPIPSEYRWYLRHCGGGVIGSERVDGLRQLPESHRKFAKEPWTKTGAFIIGWDGAGNPIGIERTTGKVLVEDHTFGGIHELAPSFMAFLAAGFGINPI